MFLAWFVLVFGSLIFYFPFHAYVFTDFPALKSMLPEPLWYYSGWLSCLMAILSLIPAGMFLKLRRDDVWFTVISAILVVFLSLSVGLMTIGAGLRNAV